MMQTQPTVQKYDLKLVYWFQRKVAIVGVLGMVLCAAFSASGVILSTSFRDAPLLPGITLTFESLTVFFVGIAFSAAVGMRYTRNLEVLKKTVLPEQ